MEVAWRFNFFILFLISLFYSSFSYSKIFPPEVHTNQETLDFVAEIEKIKIPAGGFKSFYYTKDFAIMANDNAWMADLDLKKAINLGKYLYGVGITIKESRPENKYQFEDYECAVHFFVEHRDDYWLPPGIIGSWDQFNTVSSTVASLVEIGSRQMGNVSIDFYMRSFFGNTDTDNISDTPRVLGSTSIDTYIRNIYPGIDYLKYGTFCHQLMEEKDHLSIWLEKKSGPDFQINRAYHYPKDFYIFPVPKNMMKESCEYIKKAAYYSDWNYDLSVYIKRPDLKNEYFTLWRGKEYSCEVKN